MFYETNLYNLAFGDKNPLTGEIDDKIVTDNGDSEKVLATVVAAVYLSATVFRMLGFMQQEAPPPEPDFTKWASINTLSLKNIFLAPTLRQTVCWLLCCFHERRIVFSRVLIQKFVSAKKSNPNSPL